MLPTKDLSIQLNRSTLIQWLTRKEKCEHVVLQHNATAFTKTYRINCNLIVLSFFLLYLHLWRCKQNNKKKHTWNVNMKLLKSDHMTDLRRAVFSGHSVYCRREKHILHLNKAWSLRSASKQHARKLGNKLWGVSIFCLSNTRTHSRESYLLLCGLSCRGEGARWLL